MFLAESDKQKLVLEVSIMAGKKCNVAPLRNVSQSERFSFAPFI